MTMNVFNELAEIDPLLELDAGPDWSTLAPALLAELDERATPMQTQTPITPAGNETPTRRGWLVAAAAFGAVIVIALVLTLSGGLSSDAPVAPQPDPTPTVPTFNDAPPSTTVPPTVESPVALSPAQEAFVAALGEAHATGDVDAFRSLHYPEATRDNGSGNLLSFDKVVIEMEAMYLQGSLVRFSDCEPWDQGVSCSVTISGPVEDAIAGGDLTSRARWWLDANGLVLKWSATPPSPGWAYPMFEAWLASEYPDVYAVMLESWNPLMFVGEDWPIWVEYAPLWAEAGRPIVP